MSLNKETLKETNEVENESLQTNSKLRVEELLKNHLSGVDHLKYYLDQEGLDNIDPMDLMTYYNEQFKNTDKIFFPFGKVLVEDREFFGLEELFSDVSLLRNFIKNYIKHHSEPNRLFIGVFFYHEAEFDIKGDLLNEIDFDLVITNKNIENSNNLIFDINYQLLQDLSDEQLLKLNLLEEKVKKISNINQNEIKLEKVKKEKVKKTKTSGSLSLLNKIAIYVVSLLVLNSLFIYLIALSLDNEILILIITMTVIANHILIRTLNHLLKRDYLKPKQSKLSLVLSEMDYLTPVSVSLFEEEEIIEEFEEVLEEYQVVDEHFNEVVDLNEYLINLNEHLKSHGINITIRSLRNIFANIVSERINVINSNNQQLTNKMYELISAYIGANITNLEVNNNMTEIDYLNNERSKLSQAIKIANMSKDKINFVVLSDLNYSKFNLNYKHIINHAKSPDVKLYLDLGNSEIRIPRNLWFILLPNADTNNILYGDLKNSANHLNLLISSGESLELTNNEESLKLSFYNLNDLIRDHRDTYFLEEDTWKKFDRLINYLEKSNINVFNNYIVQAIENYTAMYLLTGGDKSEVVDDLLANKVLAIITGLKVNGKDSNELSFVDFVEDLFSNEDLNNSKVVLNKIQELINQEEE